MPNGWWEDGVWDDDKDECPCCGRTVPRSHLDTDSGDCIGCEDARYEFEEISDEG